MMIPKGTILTSAHFTMKEIPARKRQHYIHNIDILIGKQARQNLYPMVPIKQDRVGSVITIKRHQDVTLIYQNNALIIKTTGRALSNGSIGEIIKVMNIDSKKVVSGTVTDNGDIYVSL